MTDSTDLLALEKRIGVGELASPVEILALKKIALVVGALLTSLNSESAKAETRALLMVLMEVTGRIEAHALVRALAHNPAVEKMRDLKLSDDEHAVAKVFKKKYGLKWPFAAHLAKDAVWELDKRRLLHDAATGSAISQELIDRGFLERSP